MMMFLVNSIYNLALWCTGTKALACTSHIPEGSEGTNLVRLVSPWLQATAQPIFAGRSLPMLHDFFTHIGKPQAPLFVCVTPLNSIDVGCSKTFRSALPMRNVSAPIIDKDVACLLLGEYVGPLRSAAIKISSLWPHLRHFALCLSADDIMGKRLRPSSSGAARRPAT
eukprot:m51a1_g12841 hypothetical protein (168) ;mRNA; r:589-1528